MKINLKTQNFLFHLLQKSCSSLSLPLKSTEETAEHSAGTDETETSEPQLNGGSKRSGSHDRLSDVCILFLVYNKCLCFKGNC